MPIDMPDKFPVLFDVSQQQLQYDSVKDGIKNVPASGGGGGDSNGILVISITLTDDDIKALGDSYTDIVPAPGVGKINVFHSAVILTNYLQSYTNVNANAGTAPFAVFTDADENDDWSSSIVNNFFTALFTVGGGNSPYAYFTPQMGEIVSSHPRADVQNTMAQWENKAIVFMVNNNGDGAFEGGDPANIMKIKVWYSVEDVP